MEPEILEELPPETARVVTQDHIDYLYERLVKLDLTDSHQHSMAHRTIDLITKIQEFHRDLDNPATSETKLPSFTELFEDLRKKTNLFEES